MTNNWPTMYSNNMYTNWSNWMSKYIPHTVIKSIEILLIFFFSSFFLKRNELKLLLQYKVFINEGIRVYFKTFELVLILKKEPETFFTVVSTIIIDIYNIDNIVHSMFKKMFELVRNYFWARIWNIGLFRL